MTKKVIIICSLILLTSCSDSQLSEANISSANDTVMFKNEDLLQEVNEPNNYMKLTWPDEFGNLTSNKSLMGWKCRRNNRNPKISDAQTDACKLHYNNQLKNLINEN